MVMSVKTLSMQSKVTLKEQIEKTKEHLRTGSLKSKTEVSNGAVIPVLKELGWDVFIMAVVIPQYSVENRRVDYALCHPARKPVILIEVRRRSQFDVPIAILTDGQEWNLYLPGEQGGYDERRSS